MSSEIDIYLKSIVRRWKKECSSADEATILYPYITSNTGEIVTSNIDTKRCEIYTLFDAELFINKSSSIQTLINLKKSGCSLYSIPNLHAKIVLTSNNIVTIGSQNLTHKGHTNLEATIITKNEQIIRKIREKIKELIAIRVELSLEMLEEMKELILPFEKEYRKLWLNAFIVNTKIAGNEKKRQLEIEREKIRKEKIEIERNKQEELQKLRKKIKQALASNKTISARVVELEKYSEAQDDYYNTYSLMPIRNNADFTKWNVKGETYNITKAFRYICLNLLTGKFGWARIFKTRITFFGRGVQMTDPLQINYHNCHISFNALWKKQKRNLEIIIKPNNSQSKIVLNGKFDLFYLTDIKIISEKRRNIESAKSIYSWIENNINEFSNIISTKLLSSFKYKHNLLGEKANVFFDNYRGIINMQLVEIKGFKILVAEPR